MITSLLLATALAASPDAAIDALESGEAAEAVTLLQAEADSQSRVSGALHYNLGTAYLAAGQAPRAVAHLRAARQLYPRNGDVSHNLALARAALEGVGEPVAEEPGWTGLITPGELGLFGLLALLAATLGGASAVQNHRARAPWLIAWVLALMLALSAQRAAVALSYQPVMVVVGQEAVARDVASVDGLEKHRLAPGYEVRVERTLGAFVLVRDARDRRGWVPKEAGLLANGR